MPAPITEQDHALYLAAVQLDEDNLYATGMFPFTELFLSGSGGEAQRITEEAKTFPIMPDDRSPGQLHSSGHINGDILDAIADQYYEVEVVHQKQLNTLGGRAVDDARAIHAGQGIDDMTGDVAVQITVENRRKRQEMRRKRMIKKIVITREILCAAMLSSTPTASVTINGREEAPETGIRPIEIAQTAFNGSWQVTTTNIAKSLSAIAIFYKKEVKKSIDLIIMSSLTVHLFTDNEGITNLINNNASVSEDFGSIPQKMIPPAMKNAAVLISDEVYIDPDTGDAKYYWPAYIVGFYSFNGSVTNSLRYATQVDDLNDDRGGIGVSLWRDKSVNTNMQSIDDNFFPAFITPEDCLLVDVSTQP